MPSKKRPTIRDVAKEAGVSKSLVSLVYSDDSKVSAERKAAVLAAAQKLGFTPNFWARSLATGASDFIGILVVDLHNAVYTEIADAIRVELLKDGHESFMTAAIINEIDGNVVVEASTVQALLDLRPRGIVVIGDLPDEKPLSTVPDTIPILKVFTIPAETSKREVNISTDDSDGMDQVIQHLFDRGHTQIAYIGPSNAPVDISRLNGYKDAMKRLNLNPLLISSDRSEQGGFQSAQKLISLNPQCTAIACFNDVVAVGAQEAITDFVETGGHNIAVTGFDNTHIAHLKRISLTSVEQNNRAIASKVAEHFNTDVPWAQLKGTSFQFTPSLIVRQSTSFSNPS